MIEDSSDEEEGHATAKCQKKVKDVKDRSPKKSPAKKSTKKKKPKKSPAKKSTKSPAKKEKTPKKSPAKKKTPKKKKASKKSAEKAKSSGKKTKQLTLGSKLKRSKPPKKSNADAEKSTKKEDQPMSDPNEVKAVEPQIEKKSSEAEKKKEEVKYTSPEKASSVSKESTPGNTAQLIQENDYFGSNKSEAKTADEPPLEKKSKYFGGVSKTKKKGTTTSVEDSQESGEMITDSEPLSHVDSQEPVATPVIESENSKAEESVPEVVKPVESKKPTADATETSSTFNEPKVGTKRPAEGGNEPAAKRKPSLKKKGSNFLAYRMRDNNPPNRGKKPLPVGQPMCLDGYRFCITGVLDSLTRPECKDLIQEYGGKVTGAVSGMTAYLVAGTDPGESKMKKAKDKKVKIIDEDELFTMIETKPPSQKKKVFKKSGRKAKVLQHKMQIKKERKVEQELWVEKYKPKKKNDLIGNKTCIDKLQGYLRGWPRTTKRAVLLSGPPGIGKTSSAKIIAEELGYSCIERNASDARSKKKLKNLVAQSISNHGIMEYTTNNCNSGKGKQVLIMDEVDGMSSGDKGGTQQLIEFIKKTKIPIICICNDRQSTKVRTLSNYCIDLRFRRPTAQQAWTRVRQICQVEGINMERNAFDKMFETMNGDIRQAINNLQIWSHDINNSLSYTDVKNRMSTGSKDANLTNWDVAPRFFNNPRAPWREQIDWYFTDRSLVPLMIEQSYLQCKGVPIKNVCLAAEAFADADILDNYIMASQGGAWSILPLVGILSTTRPLNLLRGRLSSRMGFPQQLGKIGKTNRTRATLVETYHHIEMKTGCQMTDFRLQFMPVWNDRMYTVLAEAEHRLRKGGDWETKVDEAVSLLKHYHINYSDWEFMREVDDPTRPDDFKLPDVDKKVLKCLRKKCDALLDNNTDPSDFKPKAKKVKKGKGGKKKKKKAATKKASKKKGGVKQMSLGFSKRKKKSTRKLES